MPSFEGFFVSFTKKQKNKNKNEKVSFDEIQRWMNHKWLVNNLHHCNEYPICILMNMLAHNDNNTPLLFQFHRHCPWYSYAYFVFFSTNGHFSVKNHTKRRKENNIPIIIIFRTYWSELKFWCWRHFKNTDILLVWLLWTLLVVVKWCCYCYFCITTLYHRCFSVTFSVIASHKEN